ncbi:hypothetical protein [Roseomonas sp. HF4]|uniref:hypothetical protein n=1 Tax=Roseomonas sp. HF4 TaxID=2562313 RepID=UPI0010C0AC13|nr:hypothetical protein [Roseomonas sp. HF4]
MSIGTQNVTGRSGDVIIIDDPIKPMDAVSEAERRRVNEWFDSTVISRLDDPASGAIAVVMQRVHEEDLSGHLLNKGGWHHLRPPPSPRRTQTFPWMRTASGVGGEATCWSPDAWLPSSWRRRVGISAVICSRRSISRIPCPPAAR